MNEGIQQQQIDPVGVDTLTVSAQTATPAHIAAVLLTPDGALRDHAGFVFANQTEAPGVRLADTAPGHTPSLAISLSAIPHSITAVRIVIVLDNPHLTFAAAPALQVSDLNGNTVYHNSFPGVSAASAVAPIDIERAGAGWQINTVGRGYAGGFAAVLAEHHVRVGGRGEPRRQIEAAPLTLGRPLGLAPGQAVRLRTDTGETLNLVRLGLGWDPVPGATHSSDTAAHADLDAAALLFDREHHLLDAVYFAQLTSNDGSVRHLGDSMTGQGRGENEVIAVDLSRIHPQVATVVLVVTSYSGHSFDMIGNAFCRLVDGSSGVELAHLDLRGGGSHTGMVMAKLYLAATGWKMQAIGEAIAATHPGEAVPQLTHHLA
ncbi:TerD family protein [Nocardia donostiensis]|uniref:TerD domain-containing protein n=1 Tax=Nocardia donostiensis TaxID=1538463 RepID=A0A1W0AYY1_9NOCA|nr:TerD family protein [Nocardia donostiensis]ONM48907.1 hypothetical protein B0T46_10620 [Nocardia donostiensis]OQS15473.1 hypothetical protein B0T36_09420 [Nocardia donostiensis]OQS22837.1 hypothetical protein B0T44_03845 [Nocardia donostiensis]